MILDGQEVLRQEDGEVVLLEGALESSIRHAQTATAEYVGTDSEDDL